MLLVLLASLFPIAHTNAQSPILSAPLSPDIHWQDVFWPDTDMKGFPVSQQDSNDEWYYDVIEYKKDGVTAGYAVAGYAKDPSFDSFTLKDNNGNTLDCYSGGVGGPTCAYFTTVTRPFTNSRQILVFYDLEGNVTNYYRYNRGELWGLLQDENEDIYLFGNADNPRNVSEYEEIDLADEPHLTSAQMRYNPSSTSQVSFPLNCGTEGIQYRYKFNVLKVNLNGVVQWNHLYGLATNILSAAPLRGLARTGAVKGDNLLVGGFADVMKDDPLNPGAQILSRNKFVVRLNRNTGLLGWRSALQTSTEGEIFQINAQDNKYLISGTDYGQSLLTDKGQGFVSLWQDNGNLAFASFAQPTFYKIAADVPSSVDVNNIIDDDKGGKSTSAIFVGNNIYWFLLVNNDLWDGSANGVCEGIVASVDQTGNINAMDAFGEVRAFDLWISGTPTSDGGFALITSRHSPTYFGTGTVPTKATPLSASDPGGPTIGDCLDDFDSTCAAFNDPDDRFWKLMSTCAYVRKYNSNFELEWDKLWDSTDNAPRECPYGNLKQKECMYRIIQSSVDGGLLMVGNTSDNLDDGYIVKLRGDCGIAAFAGAQEADDLIVDYTDGIYDIDQNEVWNTDKKVLGMIRIKPGAILTIENCTVEFAANAAVLSGIQVEPDGWLIVNHAVLTTIEGCDDGMWRGIEVWGTREEHQYSSFGVPSYQGRVNLHNGSIIENAWEGIQNWRPGHYETSGGIIQAVNTDFINCRIAAVFMKYQNHFPNYPEVLEADESRFSGCKFILSDHYLGDPNQLRPRARISMWGVDRVGIHGCDFINDQSVDASEKRVEAIYSHDANYIVGERCNGISSIYSQPCATQDVQPSTFIGWHQAIEALGTAGDRPIMVRNSIFQENMIGVEINGADYSQIYGNTFEVGGHPFAEMEEFMVPDENHLGIYSNATLHYSIEQNKVRPQQDAQYPGHGVLVFDSQGAENQVYKNEFEGLRTAVNGWQVNRNTSSSGGVSAGLAGLQFICNDNLRNEVDFEISRSGDPQSIIYDDSGVRQDQGSSNPEFPAGNNFSTPNSNPFRYTHIDVNSDHIYRYFWNNVAPSASEITPNTFIVPTDPVAPNNGCPNNYTLPGGKRRTQLVERYSEFESLMYTYQQTIDQGNTEGMVTQIQLTWPSQAWALRDELMYYAPFNSETVLIAAIQHNIMPHAMLLEVLLANPDALRDGTVISSAESDVNPPLPQYMIDLLYAARSETTLRTAMESVLANLHMDVQRIQKKILTAHAFADSTASGPDSTLYYLSFVKTVEGNYSRAAALVDRDMYSTAINLLDSMLVHYRLSNDREAEMNQLKSLYALLENVNSGGRTIANMDANEIQAMQALAEDAKAGIAARKAQNALCFHYDICYDHAGQPKSIATPRSPKPTYKELVAALNTSSAYPNPADNYLTVSYTLLHSKAN